MKLNLHNPGPMEMERMISELIVLNLQKHQWNMLALKINEFPQNIYPNNFINPEAAYILVERAMQKGLCNELMCEIDKYKNSPTVEVVQETQMKNSNNSLDTHITRKFGKMFEELLNALEKYQGEYEDNDKLDSEEFTRFIYKLEHKARFPESIRLDAINLKNENTVLQRKASKLGFVKYQNLKQRVKQLYNRILARYPYTQYSAEYRLNVLVDELYSILPEEYQDMDDTIENLQGIVFDTTYSCLIFNE